MFCEIITLRDNGRRLRPEEWPAPVAGQLRLISSDQRHNNLCRTLRSLTHYQPWGTQMVPRLHLTDPVLLDVVGDAMLFRGVITRVEGSDVWEHEQLWLVRPRAGIDGPPLPPFDPRPFIKRVPETLKRKPEGAA